MHFFHPLLPSGYLPHRLSPEPPPGPGLLAGAGALAIQMPSARVARAPTGAPQRGKLCMLVSREWLVEILAEF